MPVVTFVSSALLESVNTFFSQYLLTLAQNDGNRNTPTCVHFYFLQR